MKRLATYFVTLSLVCLLFSACIFVTPVDSGSAGRFVAPYREDSSHAAITLERMISPVYSLVVYPDGHVLYYGENFVNETGLRESYIPKDSVKLLLDLADQIDYFNRAKDDGRCFDGAIAWSSVKSRGRSRDFFHYLCGTDTSIGLGRFERAVDRVAKTDGWILEK